MADQTAGKTSDSKTESFAELLKAAPKATTDAGIALVGTLSQTDDASKFTLTLSSGQTVTLDVAAVKRHAVIGNADGRPVVRIEVDGANLPKTSTNSALPFSLATAHQVAPDVLAALHSQASGTLGDVGTVVSADVAIHAYGSGTLGDVGTVPSYDATLQSHASGTLSDVGTIPSYDAMLQSHASGTLSDVGTIPSYDAMLHSNASGTLGDVGTVVSADVALHSFSSGTLGDVGTVASADFA
jgi:hypothetical protein